MQDPGPTDVAVATSRRVPKLSNIQQVRGFPSGFSQCFEPFSFTAQELHLLRYLRFYFAILLEKTQ